MLINAMETEEAPIERCLMLAQRVARLMRDSDAQAWLDLEQRGYPEKLAASVLGRCAKYAFRFFPDGRVLMTSLPQLEATKYASEIVLQKSQAPQITGTAENFVVAGATKDVIKKINEDVNNARNAYIVAATSYARMRGALHRWAADTLISLELGTAAEGIFDLARVEVDIFVRERVPSAAEQLVSVSERMQEGTEEALSQALTSCRRLIANVADSLFTAQPTPYVDGKGRKRDVGEEQYKNRLLAFLETNIKSGSTRAIVESQLEHLAARLDAVYEKSCKGVHADVDIAEARLVVIQTYLFLAELARYARARNENAPVGEGAKLEASEQGTSIESATSGAAEKDPNGA